MPSPAITRIRAFTSQSPSPRPFQSALSALHTSLSALPLPTTQPLQSEYLLALSTLRHWHDTISPSDHLTSEYAIANNKSNPARRVPIGLVHIIPAPKSIYGPIACIAAALAACCGVVIELEDVHPLRRVLGGLNGDTLCVVAPGEGEGDVLIDQRGGGRTVAVVDRSADIENAARVLVKARFAMVGGVYAPDLVVVNEFVKKRFLEACIKEIEVSGDDEPSGMEGVVKEAEERGQARVFGGVGGKVVEVLEKGCEVMKQNVEGRFLVVVGCSGLVDAVFGREEGTLLAGYFFAEPGAAKYLAQFMDCQASFVNHIPTQLLVGPAAPKGHALDLLWRYNPDMFTVPRPQFVPSPAPIEAARLVDELLAKDAITGKKKGALNQKIKAFASRPLKPSGQVKSLEELDFFGSGLFLGGGIVLAVVLPALGWTSYVLGKGALGYLGKWRR
ncbi:hypothetical protein OQA88_3359 [Cercophora sp. LCS_1]